MQRNRIVNGSADMRFVQIFLKSLPIADANNIKMIDRIDPWRLEWKPDLPGGSKQFRVTACTISTLLSPGVKVTQLDPKNPRLDRVEPAIVSLHLVIILSHLAM